MSSGVLAQLKVLIGADVTKLKSGLNEAQVASDKSSRKIEHNFHRLGTVFERLIGPLSATGREISVGMDAIGASAAEANVELGALGTTLGVVAAVSTAGFAALAGVTIKLFHSLEETAHAAAGVGMGVESYVKFSKAAEIFGINQEQLNQALAYFDKIISGLVRSKAGYTALKELFPNITNPLKMLQGMGTHDALLAVADALSKMKDGYQKAGIMAALFENTYGVKMVPLMNQSAAGITKLESAYNGLAQATKNNVDGAENLTIAWSSFKAGIEGITLKISSDFGIPTMLESIAHPLDTLEVLVLGFGSVATKVFAEFARAIDYVVKDLDVALGRLHLPQVPIAGFNEATKYLQNLSSGFASEGGKIAEQIVSSGEQDTGHGGAHSGGSGAAPGKGGGKPSSDLIAWLRAQTDEAKARTRAEGEYNNVLLAINGHLDGVDSATRKYRETMAKLNAIELQGVNVSKARAEAEKQFSAAIAATQAAVNASVGKPGQPYGMGTLRLHVGALTLSQIAKLHPGPAQDSMAIMRELQKESLLTANDFQKLARAFPNLTEAEVAALPAGQKMIDYLTHLEKHGRQTMETLSDLQMELEAEGKDLRGNLIQNLDQGIHEAEGQLTNLMTGQRFDFVRTLQGMGQGIVHSFIQKRLSSVLGKFGMGGKPDGTSGNPLYVTIVGPSGNSIGGILKGPLSGLLPSFPGSGKSGHGFFGNLGSEISGLFKFGKGSKLGALAKLGSMFAGFLAAGGSAVPGRSYVVGEHGPELFTPKIPGNVTPNHALARMGGTGSPAMVYNSTFNINTPDADSFRKSQGQLLTSAYRHMASMHARNS